MKSAVFGDHQYMRKDEEEKDFCYNGSDDAPYCNPLLGRACKPFGRLHTASADRDISDVLRILVKIPLQILAIFVSIIYVCTYCTNCGWAQSQYLEI